MLTDANKTASLDVTSRQENCHAKNRHAKKEKRKPPIRVNL